MKNLKTIASIIIALMILPLQAQMKQAISEESKISATGTSTIHDWEMNVNSYKSTATISIINQDVTISKSILNFRTIDLKSISSGLDNKAHDALNASKGGTVLVIKYETEAYECIKTNPRKKLETTLVKLVANKLNNTVSVWRKYYIHPKVLEAVTKRQILKIKTPKANGQNRWYSKEELTVLTLLKESLK